MPRLDPLELEFVSIYPEQAAGQLSLAEASEALAFWERVPVAAAGLLLNRIASPVRDSVLAKADAGRLAACIDHCTEDEAVRLVRSLPEGRRDQILDQVESRRRKRIERLARHQEGSVGASMSSELVRLGRSMRVDQALDHIRQGQPAPLCVLDDAGQLAGTVDPGRLLTAGTDTPVSTLVESVSPLSIAMTLERASEDEQWSSRQWLPVVDRNRRLRGVLYRARLPDPSAGGTHARSSLLASVLSGFVQTMGQLLVVILGGRSR